MTGICLGRKCGSIQCGASGKCPPAFVGRLVEGDTAAVLGKMRKLVNREPVSDGWADASARPHGADIVNRRLNLAIGAIYAYRVE
jgi:hypothetical protein